MTRITLPRSAGQGSIAVAQPRKLNRSELVFRIAIVGALLISISLAWWTLTRQLVPLEQQSQSLGMAVSHLSDEVDAMQRKWSPAEADQIRASYKDLRRQLFADETALKDWYMRLYQAAGPLALGLTVDFGKSVPQAINNDVKVVMIPASVSIEVRPMRLVMDSPYQRLLRFGQQLAAEGKRADLAELTVSGSTNSIAHALLVFNLWAGEDAGEANSASAR